MTPLPTDQATTFRPFQPSSPSADRVSGFAGGNRSLVSRTRRSSRPCCDDDGAVVKPSGSERCKGDDDDLSHVSGGKCSTVCRDGGKKHHPSSPTPSRTRPENGTSRVVACVGDAGRKDHSVTSYVFFSLFSFQTRPMGRLLMCFCRLSYRGGRGCGNPSPSQNTLSLTFNGITFSTLSGVLEHAKDYSVGGERIRIFLKIINQATSIMQLNSDFAKGLVSGIQKDPSWKMEKFSEKDVKELLEPLARQVQMAAVRQDRRKGALSTINRLWGAEVTGFLQQNTKSETCIRQIAHFATRPQISSYVDARRTVNEFVVERLISGRSRQSSRFDTTTADWIAVDKADPPSHDIPYDRLLAAGVHLGRFGEIIKGPPPIRLRSPRPLSGCVGCQDGSAQKNPSNISAGPEVGDLSRSACGKKGSRKKGLVNKSAGPDPGGDGNADNGEAKSGSSGVEDDDSSSGDDDDSDVANLPHPSSRQPSPEAPGLDILKFSSSGLGFLEAKELFDEWSL